MRNSSCFKSFWLALLLLVCSGQGMAQTLPTWTRLTQTGGSANDNLYASITDAAGNVYQVGSFNQSIVCGSLTLTMANTASYDMYLVKYNAQGNVLWARQANSHSNISTYPSASSYGAAAGYALALDATGNVYVAGTYHGELTLGGAGTTLTAQNALPALFLVKYTAQGSVVWTQQAQVQPAQGTTDINCFGLAVTPNGDIFASGNFYSTVSFGSIQVTSQGGSDAFLAKFTAAGLPQWVQRLGGVYDDYGVQVVPAPNNSVYMNGIFVDYLTTGVPTIQPYGFGRTDVFLAQFSNQGVAQWAQAFGGPQNDNVNGLLVAPSGDIYTVGSFGGTATFGSFSRTSQGNGDGFVLRCTAQGTPTWVKQIGGIGYEIATDIVLSPTGTALYVSGMFEYTVAFGNQTLVSAGGTDVFVSRYDTQGNLSWTTRGGSTANELTVGLGLDPTGLLNVGVQFSNTAQFGSLSATSRGSADALVCQLQDNTPLAAHDANKPESTSIYPNPVSGSAITVTGLPAESQAVRVSDLAGRVVTSRTLPQPFTSSSVRLELPELPVGCYIVQILMQQGGTISKKIVVQK